MNEKNEFSKSKVINCYLNVEGSIRFQNGEIRKGNRIKYVIRKCSDLRKHNVCVERWHFGWSVLWKGSENKIRIEGWCHALEWLDKQCDSWYNVLLNASWLTVNIFGIH